MIHESRLSGILDSIWNNFAKIINLNYCNKISLKMRLLKNQFYLKLISYFIFTSLLNKVVKIWNQLMDQYNFLFNETDIYECLKFYNHRHSDMVQGLKS